MAAELLKSLEAIVGEGNVLHQDDLKERVAAWETHQPCHAKAIVRPASTQQVSDIMRLCHAQSQTVVPYGGLTNLVQGCQTTPADIAISFEKMNRVESVDATAHTMVAEAGVTMRAAQEAADTTGLFFPVDIGARDTCMLGGNVASNAGGTKVIRYGMMRDSVLGLEAVLADGTIISSMNRFLKNNSGFDLKQLFIGTEGTLGLITRLVLRLREKARTHNVALVACRDYDNIVSALTQCRSALGGSLCGFEVMWASFYDKVTLPVGKIPSPFETRHPFYAVIESMGMNTASDDAQFEATLADMFESGDIADAVVAKSGNERQAIWQIRGEVEWLVKDCYNFDVSLPIADVGQYVDSVTRGIHQRLPKALVAAFGHLGDNNIHLSVLCEGNKTTHAKYIEQQIYDALRPYQGAISAEHGIGLEKKPYLAISRSDEEIELMKTLKRTLDPGNLLNPGKVVSVD